KAGVSPLHGTAFRMYTESSNTPGDIGAIQTGIAIANAAPAPVAVTLHLFDTNGRPTADPSELNVPANGQVTKFLSEFFPSLPSRFRGLLRISATSDVSVVGIRGRMNERGDFLVATTPPAIEMNASDSGPAVLPQLISGGGYTSEIILFSNETH